MSWEDECKRHRETLYGIAEALGMHVSRDESGDMQMPCGSDILAELKERLTLELPTADDLVNLLYSEGYRVNTPIALANRVRELILQYGIVDDRAELDLTVSELREELGRATEGARAAHLREIAALRGNVFQVTADEFNRANKEYDRLNREAFKENGNQHGKGPSYGYCLNLELAKRKPPEGP